MPDWSNASPVIVRDKIFICGERTKLRCLSLQNGKILMGKRQSLSAIRVAFLPSGDRLFLANKNMYCIGKSSHR